MIVQFASKEIERICIDRSVATRRFGAPYARAIALRMASLRVVDQLTELLAHTGNWEHLRYTEHGDWSGRLSQGRRIIVRPVVGDEAVIVDVEGYHT